MRNPKEHSLGSVSTEKTVITGDFETRWVKIAGKELLPGRSQKLCSHSPDGFNWGYGGSGPAQLALAILLELTDDEHFSLYNHQAFKWAFITSLPDTDFILPLRGIRQWIVKVKASGV